MRPTERHPESIISLEPSMPDSRSRSFISRNRVDLSAVWASGLHEVTHAIRAETHGPLGEDFVTTTLRASFLVGSVMLFWRSLITLFHA
jgi:hypothetical protein